MLSSFFSKYLFFTYSTFHEADLAIIAAKCHFNLLSPVIFETRSSFLLCLPGSVKFNFSFDMKSRDNLINWLVSLKNLEAGITDSVIKRIVGVIDDDIDITTLFHDALCENVLEASVYAFNDPISAIEHFTENKENYALVISDLRMTGLNGLELLKKVKAANPKVRTILMSAHNFDEDPTYQQYMKEGIIDASIEKLVTIHRLCQRVKEELQSYQIALSK